MFLDGTALTAGGSTRSLATPRSPRRKREFVLIHNSNNRIDVTGPPAIASQPRQDLEPTENLLAKQRESDQRGTESGTVGITAGFSELVAGVMRLPLSEEQKAEAIRRLLGEIGGKP